MTWLYPAEIVPLKIRAPTNALATSSNWIFNFMGKSISCSIIFMSPTDFSSCYDNPGRLRYHFV